MLVSPVSSAVSRVRFCGEQTNVLERKGAYAKPETAQGPATENNETEKKSGVGKTIRNTAIGLAVVAVALATLTKTNVLKVLDKSVLENTKFYSPKKIGHYLAKAGDAILKYTYEPVAKLINKWRGKGPAAA